MVRVRTKPIDEWCYMLNHVQNEAVRHQQDFLAYLVGIALEHARALQIKGATVRTKKTRGYLL